jgi:hypothetical protein
MGMAFEMVDLFDFALERGEEALGYAGADCARIFLMRTTSGSDANVTR